MQEETKRILDMVENGTITAQEAKSIVRRSWKTINTCHNTRSKRRIKKRTSTPKKMRIL